MSEKVITKNTYRNNIKYMIVFTFHRNQKEVHKQRNELMRRI